MDVDEDSASSLAGQVCRGRFKIKCILSRRGQCTNITINDHVDTQSCQTLQLIIAFFFISLL